MAHAPYALALKLALALVVATSALARADDGSRFAFFQKVGVMKRAAGACDDRDIDNAITNVLNTSAVQNLQSSDVVATAGIVAGVVAFDRRVAEQGLAFNCELVKKLAREEGYLK